MKLRFYIIYALFNLYRTTSSTESPELTLAVVHLVAKPVAFIALDALLLLLLLPRRAKSLAQRLRRGRRRVPERVPNWRPTSPASLSLLHAKPLPPAPPEKS
jgi:hypothetical protein